MAAELVIKHEFDCIFFSINSRGASSELMLIEMTINALRFNAFRGVRRRSPESNMLLKTIFKQFQTITEKIAVELN